MRFFFKVTFIFTIWLLVLFTISDGRAQNKKIAIFGSSIAKGSGDTTGTGGYTGFIKQLLEQRGWTVVNVSKSGDNTAKISLRFDAHLLPEKAKYVILGLSLGNEGLYSTSELTRNRVSERYRSGMQQLIQMCREHGMYPIVAACYARNDFEQVHYEATKNMNLIINTWDVPSINLLGAIENGKGQWADGFWKDNSHPNVQGHKELFYAFVPSLFDAIEAGKKIPYKIQSSKYLSISNEKSEKPLSFACLDPIHSFSISFKCSTKNDGTIAVIQGLNNFASIGYKKGKIFFQSTTNQIYTADTTSENEGWQYIVISHLYASGTTQFFVNGKLISSIHEKLDFKEFVLGGNAGQKLVSAPGEAAYKDLLVYRSSLNINEVMALYNDLLLQSSMEIYSPLNDEKFEKGASPVNYAQSLSKVIINGNALISKENRK